MISIPYVYILLILIIIWAIYRTIVLIKSKENNIIREVTINIFFIYFLILINLTICKMGMLKVSIQNKLYINFIPFTETVKMFKDNIIGVGNAFYNVIGNVILFVPLGFFIPLLFNKKNRVSIILLYGFSTSLLIELIQLITAQNITDIDDIIFNTLGAVLGFYIYNIFYNFIEKTKLIYLVTKVTSKFDGSLLALSIKPLSVMVCAISIFTIIYMYNSTISRNESNEDIAKVVFSDSTNYQAVKDISEYKLFLQDNGDYVDLISLESVLNNRWLNSKIMIGQYEKCRGNYSICPIFEKTIDESNNSISFAVFGKNRSANKVEITFDGDTYIEELKINEYFLVTFPIFKTFKDSDIDNIYDVEKNTLLKIRFLDLSGNEYNEMKFAN